MPRRISRNLRTRRVHELFGWGWWLGIAMLDLCNTAIYKDTMSKQHPVEPIYKAIGANITRLRLKASMSQAQLGLKLTPPTTRSCIANMELAVQRTHIHTLEQIAILFGIPTERLIKGKRIKRGRLEAGSKAEFGARAALDHR